MCVTYPLQNPEGGSYYLYYELRLLVLLSKEYLVHAILLSCLLRRLLFRLPNSILDGIIAILTVTCVVCPSIGV